MEPGVLAANESGLLEAMNRERASQGLSQLAFRADLLVIARRRSADMTENGYFAHFGPDGESVYSPASSSGLRFSALGENLARVGSDAQRSVQVAIEKLMESPPHRANILNPLFTHVAVGASTDQDGVTVFSTVYAGS